MERMYECAVPFLWLSIKYHMYINKNPFLTVCNICFFHDSGGPGYNFRLEQHMRLNQA
jgi:hypothetical protein